VIFVLSAAPDSAAAVTARSPMFRIPIEPPPQPLLRQLREIMRSVELMDIALAASLMILISLMLFAFVL
jgi:hypothetical protein